MREVLSLLVAVALFSIAACVENDADVSAQRAALSQPDFVLDPPGPAGSGWEPLPQSTAGAPLPAPPDNPAYLALQRKYLDALKLKSAEWQKQALSPSEINKRQAELKRSMLGE